MYIERDSRKNNAPADRTAIRVTVMIINPYLLHVYWQIPSQDLEDIQGTPGKSLLNARPVLRFHDITGILFDGTNAHRIFDVEVDLRTMKWNVPIWSADKSYVIDLGCKAPDGRFSPMARSNVVNVPRADPSPRLAERYLRVERGQIKSLEPAPVAPIPPRKPVEALRLETMHGVRKQTREELFKDKAEHVPEVDITEEKGVIRGVSYPFDLVQMAEERFSFGVSSMRPTRETNS
jgi:hypothetical protein